MSLINEYRSTEAAIAQLQQRLDALKNDERLKDEIAFEEGIRAVMAQHGKSEKEVLALFSAVAQPQGKMPRKEIRQRAVKVYKNPHTGELLETKGGNNKTMKSWKAEYGAEAVESWRQS